MPLSPSKDIFNSAKTSKYEEHIEDSTICKIIRRSNMKRSEMKKTTSENKSRCGLCGKSKKNTQTGCCKNCICNDYNEYVLFSYANNSCARNHDRYTLCSHHYHNKHKGNWKDCEKCKADFEPEMYNWYGTNEYNFDKLDALLPFMPTQCHKCKKIISLSNEGYTISGGKYYCDDCMPSLWN